MDILVIILVAVVLFAGGLLISKGYSIFTAWNKARAFGLNPSFSEAKSLTKFYELENTFLRACKEFKDSDSSISIKDIVRHQMADGDTLALLDQWKKLKAQNLEISFPNAVLLDLDGKDLVLAALEKNKTYKLDFQDKLDDTFPYQYSCEFRISSESSGWVEVDLKFYQEKIQETIDNAFLECEISELESLPNLIYENYLNQEFWKSLCHGEVMHQEFKLGEK